VKGTFDLMFPGFCRTLSNRGILDRESYEATKSRTRDLMVASPKCVSEAIFDIFTPYNIPVSTVNDLTKSLAKSPQLLDFLIHFGHVLPEPSGSRPLTCALTIAAGYFIGGLIPLLPYIVVDRHEVILALYWSIVIMFGALFVFGYAKTGFTGGWNGRGRVVKGIKAGFQMVIVGSVAAGASMALVRAFEYSSHPP
jgi:vacuolar iron transporter family protein